MVEGAPSTIHRLDCTALLHQLEQQVKIVRLLGLLGDSIRVADPTPSTLKNDLVALLTHAHPNRVHQATTRVAPVARQNVHMLRAEAKGTMVPITPVGHGQNHLLTILATKATVFCISTHHLISLSCLGIVQRARSQGSVILTVVCAV